MELWAKNLSHAKKVQELLRSKISILPYKKKVRLVCGLDAHHSRNFIYACASLFNFPDLTHLKDSFSRLKLEFPYIPGFLAFREGKALLCALRKLSLSPDVLFVDGHGIAHPNSIGIATHLGIVTGIPSVGCAKSALIGEYEDPGKKRGSFTYIYIDGKKVGAVLRTKNDTKPVFVSPGHMVDIHTSIDLILKCAKKFRLPEPIRRAHTLSKKLSRRFL